MGRIRGTSTAGAQGPMQFLPATWKAYGMGGDINDPRDAIFGAANYLKANGGAAGRMDNALFRYNNSNRYVRAVTLYATQIEADPTAYPAYHGWQVYYITPWGDLGSKRATAPESAPSRQPQRLPSDPVRNSPLFCRNSPQTTARKREVCRWGWPGR